MPAAMTFQSLQTSLQGYMERATANDPTFLSQLPFMINNAERHINRLLKIQGDLIPVQGAFVAGTAVYAKPSGWRRTVSMHYGALTNKNSRTGIYPRSYEYARAYWQDDRALAPPEYYADYDYQHWLIVPTPDIAYPWEIMYYRLNLLDPLNTQNYLTDYAPEVLLYAALCECEPFIKNDPRLPMWKEEFQERMQALSGEDLAKIFDRAQKRTDA